MFLRKKLDLAVELDKEKQKVSLKPRIQAVEVRDQLCYCGVPAFREVPTGPNGEPEHMVILCCGKTGEGRCDYHEWVDPFDYRPRNKRERPPPVDAPEQQRAALETLIRRVEELHEKFDAVLKKKKRKK